MKESDTILMLLAAGSSKRFGSPKQLALIDGQPLIRHMMTQLSSSAWKTLVILGDHYAEIVPLISDLDATIIVNPSWKKGIASSLQFGFRMVESVFPAMHRILVVPGDMYLLTKEDLKGYLDFHEKQPLSVIATKYGDRPGAPALFPRHTWSLMDEVKGDEGAQNLLEDYPDVVMIENPHARTDLDVPGDLRNPSL